MTTTSATFLARGANFNSANADLNVRSLSQVPITSLTFVETDSSALSFTFNGGLPDPDKPFPATRNTQT